VNGWSQTAPKPATSASEQEEPIVLSPFNVTTSNDVGYTAKDGVAGGRMRVDLLQSPTDSTVLTREFLDDIMAFNTDDAAKWLPNSDVTENQTDGRDFGGRVTFRGLPTSGGMRNFFNISYTPDTYVVDRIEAGRGGNSIIFAESNGGGRQNFMTKRAMSKNAAKATFTVDSEGGRRETLDVNRRLSDKVFARINLLDQRGRRWIDGYMDNKIGIQGAMTIRPWKGGEVRLEAEYFRQDLSALAYTYSEQSSSWNQSTVVTAPLTATPATATGLTRFTSQYVVLTTGANGDMTATDLKNFARTNGTGLSFGDGIKSVERPFLNFPTLPSRDFMVSPRESFYRDQIQNYTAVFEQKLGNLFLEASAFKANVHRLGSQLNFNNAYLDVNKVLPDGSQNSNFGKFYSEVWPNPTRGGYPQSHAGYKLSLGYPVKWSWGSQTFAALLEREEGKGNFIGWAWAVTKDPYNAAISPVLTATANRVVIRRYWDLPRAPFKLPTNGNGWEFTEYVNRDSGSSTANNTWQLATVGNYFNDRLILVGGYRFDNYAVDGRTGVFDVNGYPAGNTYNEVKTKPRTGSVGATFFPIRSVGLYASANEGFQTQSDQNPWIGDRGPVYYNSSKGKSAGLRFRLLDGGLVGSVGYYKTTIADKMMSISNTKNLINQLWADLNRNIVFVGPFSGADDTINYDGHGYEADFTASLTRQLRLMFNFSTSKNAQVNSAPDHKAYLAKHLAEWQVGANDPANPNRARINTNIQNLQNAISGYFDGRELNGTYKSRANVFLNYSFVGKLKGLRIGGGANIYGRRLIGNGYSSAFDYIYSDAYSSMTATAGYTFRLRKASVDIGLNVSNALNYKDPIYSGTAVYNSVSYRNGYSYLDPRKATLTVGVSF
jgi:outer membrane receptor for monomeric catechols